MRELLSGAMTQLRVVYAVALRETRTRFGQHRAGYLWALLEPILWIATFAGLYSMAGRHGPYGMDLVPFLATGIVTYSFFAKTVERGANAIDANRALLYYPHVQTIDLILARTMLEAMTYGVVFVVILGAHALWIRELAIDDALTVVWGMFLASALGMSVGLVLCALSVLSNSVDRLRGPLMRPLFWISGLFFTANSLPSQVREIMLWNPVLHCSEIVRQGWFPQYQAYHADSAYVGAWIIAFSFLGLILERIVRSRVQLT